MDPIIDWQISRREIKARGQYLLETAKWADCHFLVGGGQLLAGHKLILAMASPVFEAMFYGGLAEKNDPIEILDVQAEAFKALLEYIYTDKININTVDKAFELCYAAKKYMLPYVVEQCTTFLWSDLCPKNACRAYEFAKLFEEPRLTEKCLQIICTKTTEVIQDSSFEDVELSTIITILDQDSLNVDNELDLFFAVNRYAEKHGLNNQNREANASEEQSAGSRSNNASPQPSQFDVEAGPSHQVDQPDPQAQPQQNQPQQNRLQESPTIHDAIRKIRFLTLTPQQFAEGPARTNLLTKSEAFAILMNISTPNSIYPMPEGFTQSKMHRVYNFFSDSRSPSPFQNLAPHAAAAQPQIPIPARPSPPLHPALPVAQIIPLEQDNSPHNLSLANQAGSSYNFERERERDRDRDMRERERERDRNDHDNKLYCTRIIRQQTECLNTSVLECSVNFSVDRNGICILGLQIPTQISHINTSHNPLERYCEIIYAHLLDGHGSRLTYTHSNQRVTYDSVIDVVFNRPVIIQRNKIYKVGVVFNKVGWYQMSSCFSTVTCGTVPREQVTFTFQTSGDTYRDGLIRGIIYTNTRD